MDKETIKDHVAGCLLGAAIGDALGRLSEGMTPYGVIRKYNFLDGFFPINGERGKFSNETLCSLAIAKTIGNKGQINSDLIGEATEDISKKRSMKFEGSNGVFSKNIGIIAAASIIAVDNATMIEFMNKSCEKSHSNKHHRIAAGVFACILRECIRNSENLSRPFDLYDSDHSLLSKMLTLTIAEEEKTEPSDDLLSDRISLLRSKLMAHKNDQFSFAGLNGTSGGPGEVLGFSLFSFFSAPDEFKTVYKVASMGGAATLNSCMVGAMVGGYLGASLLPADMKEQVFEYLKIDGLAHDLVETLWVSPVLEEKAEEE